MCGFYTCLIWIFFCFFAFKVLNMPFKQEFIQVKAISIHLLTFEEFNPLDFLSHLSAIESERLNTIKSPLKQQEFVATRILRDRIFGHHHIHYNEHGAPYIKDKQFISISHSRNIVGIAVCADFQIGFDLEFISGKAKKVCSKFLNNKELQAFNLQSELETTKLWSAKESLYKLANRTGIDFKTQLLIEPGVENCLLGKIIQANGYDLVEITTFEHLDFIVTLNQAKITKINNTIHD